MTEPITWKSCVGGATVSLWVIGPEAEPNRCHVSRLADVPDLIAALRAAPAPVREEIGVEVYDLPKAIEAVRVRRLEHERDAANGRADRLQRERDSAVSEANAATKDRDWFRGLAEISGIFKANEVLGTSGAETVVTAAERVVMERDAAAARAEKLEEELADATAQRDRKLSEVETVEGYLRDALRALGGQGDELAIEAAERVAKERDVATSELALAREERNTHWEAMKGMQAERNEAQSALYSVKEERDRFQRELAEANAALGGAHRVCDSAAVSRLAADGDLAPLVTRIEWLARERDDWREQCRKAERGIGNIAGALNIANLPHGSRWTNTEERVCVLIREHESERASREKAEEAMRACVKECDRLQLELAELRQEVCTATGEESMVTASEKLRAMGTAPRAPSADLPLAPGSAWDGNAINSDDGYRLQVSFGYVEVWHRSQQGGCYRASSVPLKNVLAVLAKAGLLPVGIHPIDTGDTETNITPCRMMDQSDGLFITQGPRHVYVHVSSVIDALSCSGLLPAGDGVPRERVREMMRQSFNDGARSVRECYSGPEPWRRPVETILAAYDREPKGAP